MTEESAIIEKGEDLIKNSSQARETSRTTGPGLGGGQEGIGVERGASSSQSIWEEARVGRLPPRAEYRVILLATSAKSLHDDKRIPTGLRSAPEGLSVYDYGDCEGWQGAHCYTRIKRVILFPSVRQTWHICFFNLSAEKNYSACGKSRFCHFIDWILINKISSPPDFRCENSSGTVPPETWSAFDLMVSIIKINNHTTLPRLEGAPCWDCSKFASQIVYRLDQPRSSQA